MENPAILTEGLTKYYGRQPGILGLDLQVQQGEFFGFIGPNGAGKSTTIRTLLGLIRPTGGRVALLGQELPAHRQEILRQVGYLAAEPAFYPGMRVGELLSLSARLRRRDCSREAAALCERLSLDPSKRIEALSLGNRKKAAIVCALQHHPRLCILDEPTSGLDPLIQKEFFTILRERNAAGATIFLSTHILTEVDRYCSRAAVIRGGRLLVCDSVQALAHTSAKLVTLSGVAGQPALPELPGIRDLQKTEEGGLRFFYSGPAGPLLSALAALQPTDLQIAQPGLEELFLHYYDAEGKEGGKGA